jgi:hypothetical protein
VLCAIIIGLCASVTIRRENSFLSSFLSLLLLPSQKFFFCLPTPPLLRPFALWRSRDHTCSVTLYRAPLEGKEEEKPPFPLSPTTNLEIVGKYCKFHIMATLFCINHENSFRSLLGYPMLSNVTKSRDLPLISSCGNFTF